jgi:hypothetical protein
LRQALQLGFDDAAMQCEGTDSQDIFSMDLSVQQDFAWTADGGSRFVPRFSICRTTPTSAVAHPTEFLQARPIDPAQCNGRENTQCRHQLRQVQFALRLSPQFVHFVET